VPWLRRYIWHERTGFRIRRHSHAGSNRFAEPERRLRPTPISPSISGRATQRCRHRDFRPALALRSGHGRASYSSVTPKIVYFNRRRFLARVSAAIGLGSDYRSRIRNSTQSRARSARQRNNSVSGRDQLQQLLRVRNGRTILFAMRGTFVRFPGLHQSKVRSPKRKCSIWICF
jgi:hypothetical protein